VPPGERGPKGEPGAKGEPGNANVIYSTLDGGEVTTESFDGTLVTKTTITPLI
jgi:hypothetical protein